jgi:hypothetical protein
MSWAEDNCIDTYDEEEDSWDEDMADYIERLKAEIKALKKIINKAYTELGIAELGEGYDYNIPKIKQMLLKGKYARRKKNG